MSLIFDTTKIHDFYKLLETDEHNRYDSWKHCFNTFSNINQDDDILALHLGFYLASWGMYRGSAALLQKSYKVHLGAITLIRNFYHLRCDELNEVSTVHKKDILELNKQLFKHYNSFTYFDNKNVLKCRKPTDTLISKIILGTLGCSPAFDRYFNDGVKKHNFSFTSFSDKNFDEIFNFVDNNKSELLKLQSELMLSQGLHYPLLKLVDIYFWHEGFEMSSI
jgi:hypothetical protein